MASKFSTWIIGIALCSAVVPSLVIAQTKPVPQPTVQSPGVKAVGKVNPTNAIDVVVTNNTSVTQSVGFSGGANVKIEPGEKTKLSFASAPINLFIYPFGQTISTKYNVTLSENTVNVQVAPLNSVTPGDNALNISRSGVVYIN